MRVFRRVTDILSASLNDLIDKFEDPEKMLRQAIREMEESVADAMEGAARDRGGSRAVAVLANMDYERWTALKLAIEPPYDAVGESQLSKSERRKAQQARRATLPFRGLACTISARRQYPHGHMAAHVVGYIGALTAEE